MGQCPKQSAHVPCSNGTLERMFFTLFGLNNVMSAVVFIQTALSFFPQSFFSFADDEDELKHDVVVRI